ncbi:hypothetical protein Ac2012v2_005914 [Leucoagaricus gongylophorus]
MAAPQLPDTETGLFIPEPQVGKIWEEAQKLIPRAGHEVFDQVIKNSSSEVANGIRDIKNSLVQVVEQAQQIRTDIQKAIDEKDITMEHVTEMFTREIAAISEKIEDLLSKDHGAPLEDRTEKAEARTRLVDKVMDKIQIVYIRVLVEVGIPREQAENQAGHLFAMFKRLLLTLGEFIDNHPHLLELLIFAVSKLFLPEILILRPIMTLIGSGPVRGEGFLSAASAQKILFGATIPTGSWFSILQRIGMEILKYLYC